MIMSYFEQQANVGEVFKGQRFQPLNLAAFLDT